MTMDEKMKARVAEIAGAKDSQAATRIAVGQRRVDQQAREEACIAAKDAGVPFEDPGPWEPLTLFRGDMEVTFAPTDNGIDEAHFVLTEPSTKRDAEVINIDEVWGRLSGYMLRGYILKGLQPIDVSHLEMAHRIMLDLHEDREFASIVGEDKAEYDKWVSEGKLETADDRLLDMWLDDASVPEFLAILGVRTARVPNVNGISPDWLVAGWDDMWVACEMADWK